MYTFMLYNTTIDTSTKFFHLFLLFFSGNR